MRILLVKMSSLGDVVHALPGVTDAARARGGDVSFDWVVEEAFAAIPARHPAVDRVIPIAWRRWRGALSRSGGELRDFLRRLRARRYDLVLDAQGLVKSGVVTALARGGMTAGPSRSSAREGAAAWFYRRQVQVPKGEHAIDRVRRLFAMALGYAVPEGEPDYGLPACGAVHPPRCLLLHGTTWESKQWPERFWAALAGHAAGDGYQVLLPWGNAAERQRAERIAAAAPARVLPRQSLDALADDMAGAALAIGVDSGLAHLCAALSVPTLTLYGPTSSALTGCRGRTTANLQTPFVCSPCLSRRCLYRGPVQTVDGEPVEPACFATLPPELVWREAVERFA